MRLGPVSASFSLGHAASDLSFTFGVAQEIPLLFIPLSAATVGAHWALVRGREHYPSDVLAGGAPGISVARVALGVGASSGSSDTRPSGRSQ